MGKFEMDGGPGRSRRRHGHDPNDFFGIDVEKMSPKAQVATSLAVLIPVALTGIAVLTLFPHVWWLIFVFGWTVFPAFGLLVRGIAGFADQPRLSSPDTEPRQIAGSSRGGVLQVRSSVGTPVVIGPKVQIALALSASVPAIVGAWFAYYSIYDVYGLFFAFFWPLILSFGLLINGVLGVFGTRGSRSKISLTTAGERELLNALQERGELSSARAAMETSLTVAEADGIFKRLAEGGHLDVRVRGGGMFYALWEPEGVGELRESRV